MKRVIQFAVFVSVLVMLTIYAKTISNEIVSQYELCISFLANHTLTDSQILGV